MPIYIAMLRGINVGGQKMIKMESLRASFETAGFSGVRTYVQSGNLIFDAGRAVSPASLNKKLRETILRDFGFSVPVVLRTPGEMKKIIDSNPFMKEKGIDVTKLHVTFLSDSPGKTALERLDGLKAKPDRFSVIGQEIHLHCPDGYGISKLSNSAFEKLLAMEATTRNWKTVNALLEMAPQ